MAGTRHGMCLYAPMSLRGLMLSEEEGKMYTLNNVFLLTHGQLLSAIPKVQGSFAARSVFTVTTL
jgi:hypothetical protein